MDSTMSDAAHEVFHTTELLENILLQVNDIKTLLLSQRTCKLFQGTITGSIRLQRALFFRSDSGAIGLKNPLLDYWGEPITTSEGILIDIEDDVRGVLGCHESIYFCFRQTIPRLTLSTTGSWRSMRACHRIDGPRWVALSSGGKPRFETYVPAHLRNCGVGEILDWALKKCSESRMKETQEARPR